ncbi:MAG: cupin domain-containing protein [Candidatus Dormibacteria bacterium]
MGGALVRLGVFAPGQYHWHRHQQEDESFLVLQGGIQIELEGHPTVELAPRQAFSVPAGRRHRPVVSEPSVVLMIEKAGVVPTGS